jgi:hypothetical protein
MLVQVKQDSVELELLIGIRQQRQLFLLQLVATGYFVNTTSSGAVTVTLPAGSAGDIVSLADYAGTFGDK